MKQRNRARVLRPKSESSSGTGTGTGTDRETEPELSPDSSPVAARRRPGRPRRPVILTPGIAAKERQARRNHQRLPDLPPDATPAARLARRRRGGRPPGVRMSLEARIRRAYAADRTYLVLNGTDVLELHALYDIINPAGDLLLRSENGNSRVAGPGPGPGPGSSGSSGFVFNGQINARWLRLTLGQLMVRAAAAAAEAEDGIGK